MVAYVTVGSDITYSNGSQIQFYNSKAAFFNRNMIPNMEYEYTLSFYIKKYIHKYIIGHYNPSLRIIDLVSHTTYVVCLNFIR